MIAGCGFGGIDVAVSLKQRLGDDVAVVAINKAPYHTLNAALPELISRKISLDEINVPLDHYFKVHGVGFVQDTLLSIDPIGKKVVTAAHGPIFFDFLLLDIGNIPADFGIEGLSSEAFTVKPAIHSYAISCHIENLFREYASMSPEDRIAAMTFVVGGGGFSGIEVITEIVDFTRVLARHYNVPLEALSWNLMDAAPMIGYQFGAAASRTINRELKRRGVRLYLGEPIKKLDGEIVCYGDACLRTKTFVWTGGFKTHPLLKDSGFPVDNSGAVLVNEFLQVQGFPYVFASGDNASFADPTTHQKISKTALVALDEEPLVAANIVAAIQNRPLQAYAPRDDYAYYVSVGTGKAVWIYRNFALCSRLFYFFKKRFEHGYARKYFSKLR